MDPPSHSAPPVGRATRLLWESLRTVTGLGCTPLRPFADVLASLSPDSFVRVGDRLVHVEQAGSGEAVLLVHGFGGSTYSWRKVVPALAAGFHVVAVDLAGFGWSERPKGRGTYTLSGQEDLILGVADALAIDRFHLVGHSYGGGISLWIATRHGARLRSLTLVDSTLPAYAVSRRRGYAAVRLLVALFVRAVALRPPFVRRSLERSVFDRAVVTDELVDAYVARLAVEGAVDAYRGLTAPVRGPVPQVDLTALRLPTMIIWGSQDRLLPLLWGERAANAIPGAQLVVIERCGHLPMEEQPEVFATALQHFLA